jgi:Novel STAND NTPase 1
MSVDVGAPDATELDADVGAAHYRYPGSPPFRDTELDRRLFRGRAQEADTVLHSILSTNLFLLYAESGLGKTSLLNAGVMHELRARAHWPVSVRLNDPSKSPVQCIRELIEAAAASDPDVDLIVERAGDADGGTDNAAGAGTLWDLLASMEVWRNNELQQPVVILDQFEELFTLDWDDEARLGFIEQFGEVVRGHRSDAVAAVDAAPPEVRFVIVIREDALGELEALAADVPQIMRNRFRLGPLDPQQAEAAVLEPARLDDERLQSQRFEYTEAAAREILDFLRADTQRGSSRLAAAVDPSQLQIVCQYVEQAILPGKVAALGAGEVAQIDASDLGGRDGLDRILSDFYRRTIESLPTSDQRSARNLCEDGLINRSGRRLSLEQDEIVAGFDVRPATLQALVDGRLLRADPRVGSVYYELSHDTLVGPIRAYRDEQRAQQRRRRRRVLGIAVAVVAVAVAIGAIVIAARRESSDSVEQPAIELTVGESAVEGAIEQPGAVVLYTVDADTTDPLVVVVEPEPGLNAVIDVTTANEARVTRQVDQNSGAGAERMVIPPVPEGEPGQEIRITSFDSTLGSFEVSVDTTDAVELTSDDDASAGALSGLVPLGVFSVQTTADVASTVTVTPVDAPPSAPTGNAAAQGSSGVEQKPLDLEIEVIGPMGVGRRFDGAGQGQSETVTLPEPPGVHFLVVRGKDGTTGRYEVELESSALAMSGELELDESVRGVISAGQDVAEFTFTPPDDGTFSIEVVPDGQLDAVIELESEDGVLNGADSGGNGSREVALVTGSAATYTVRVSGWEGSAGGFEITAARLDSSSIGIGERKEASGEGVFEIEVDEGALLAFEVQPTSGAFVAIAVTDPDGFPIGYANSATASSSAVAVIGGRAGTYLATVTFPDRDAAYTASLTGLDTQQLAPDDRASAVGAAAFEVAVDEGEVFEFVVEPGSSTELIEVEVRDPAGFNVGDDYSEGGQPAVVWVGGFAGNYTVIVRPDSDTEFTVSTSPIDPQPLSSGDVASVAGNAVFEVEVGDGEFFELAAEPGSDSFVEIEVTDPLGVPIAFAFADGGDGRAATSFGGRAGTYLAFARAVDGGEFTASLTSLDAQALAPGESITVDGDALFEVDAQAGDRYLLTVEPASADAFIDAELLDEGGVQVLVDGTSEPGATLESAAIAASDGPYYLIVRSINGDGRVVVSLATEPAE